MSPTGQTSGGNGQAPTAANDPAAHGQAPTPAQANNSAAVPPTASAQNGPAPAATPPTTSQDFAPPSADEWKRIQQEMAEARRDAAKYRDELKKRDEANMTAEQKRERDFAEMQTRHLEATLDNQRLRTQVAGFRLASQLGIADIGAALALVQSEHGHDLAFDENTNEPKNLDKLLAQVLKDHPILNGQAAQSAQPGQPQRPPANSGPAMSPARGQAQPAQTILNRPLRGWEGVNWKP